MLDWSDWEAFCATLDIGALVPEAYARYRPAVTGGLAFFLGGLPPERTMAILAGQAALPAEAGLDERLAAVARQCPALHKLGQVVARDRRLPEGLRRVLQELETMAPAQGLDELRGLIEAELGPLAAHGVTLDEPPLAEASVAVVVPFAWRQPGDGEGAPRRGVFKVLKPGIADRLNQELDLLQRVGAFLDERCRTYDLPAIDYEGTFIEVRDLLRREVRLEQEQAHLAEARAFYAGQAGVAVPEVFPALCTPRLTAMERLDGRKVTEVAALSGAERRRLAALIVEALLARPLWSAGPATMFHADPHAGNLMVTTDGRLGLLDWSLVGRLSKDDRVHLSQVLLGAVRLDPHRIVGGIAGLARGPVDEAALRRVADAGLGRLPAGGWPGLAWLTGLMDAAVTGLRLRFGGDLVMFRKVLHTLEGVVADVAPDCPVDAVLARAFATRLAMEWGARLIAPPFARDFPTHLSNADLAELAMVAPQLAAQHWLRMYRA